MALILHIETATEVCSAALSRDGELIAFCESNDATSHSAVLTLHIEQCLERAGVDLAAIDAVSVSSGPGSYTSLRVGASVAKGICYALRKPLVVVDTLQSLAWACGQHKAVENEVFCPMIDARRMEVYAALFDADANRLCANEAKIISADFWEEWGADFAKIGFSGSGAPKCEEVLKNPKAVFYQVVCSSAHHVFLANRAFVEKKFIDAAYFVPDYGKAPNITVSAKIL